MHLISIQTALLLHMHSQYSSRVYLSIASQVSTMDDIVYESHCLVRATVSGGYLRKLSPCPSFFCLNLT